MDCTDPFPWASLLAVTGTLLGAIIGGWLGHWFASRQAADQRSYQDRTRFHDEKLRAYSGFLSASLAFRAVTASVRRKGGRENCDAVERTNYHKAHDEIISALGHISLMGSDSVQMAAYEIWEYVVDLVDDVETSVTEADTREAVLTTALRVAMRAELGIDIAD